MNWIKIKDKAPKVRKRVLLKFQGGRICVGHRIAGEFLSWGIHLSDGVRYVSEDKVVGWQDLPKGAS